MTVNYEKMSQERLVEMLNFEKPIWSDSSQECERMAAALIAWDNSTFFNTSRLQLLKRVAMAGFQFWYCPACGKSVYSGSDAVKEVDPNWGRFQAVLEADYISYPGDGDGDLRCNYCRCYDVGRQRLRRASLQLLSLLRRREPTSAASGFSELG